MNREEVIQTLMILKAAYPGSFQNVTKADGKATIELWLRQFASDDPKIVGAAIDNLIASRTVGYSPTIGEIKEQMHKLKNADGMTDAEAWYLVEKACRRGLYNSREEFEKLPPDVQAAVGGPEQLKAWAMMDAETVNSVVASNFRKTFRTVQQREKEKAMMPESVKQYMSGVADQLSFKKTKEPKMILPSKPEPLKSPVDLPKIEPVKAEPSYKPPNDEEWARKREEAMNRLLGGRP